MIRQKNVFLSIISNWDAVKQSVKSATDSLGSADKENEKVVNSIQGKLNNLSSAFSQLSKTIVKSDFLKGLVDTGTSLISILDGIISNLNVIPMLLAGIGTAMAFKNVGEQKNTPPYASLHFVEIQKIA